MGEVGSMQILAGSLNVEIDSYLHAGYLSAYPRTFEREGSHQLSSQNVKLIDVRKAVELKSPNGATAGAAAIESPSSTLPRASMVSDTFALAVAFFFFAFLISLYYRRARKVAKPAWRPWLFAALALLVVAPVYFWAWPKYEEHSLNQLPCPWKGVAVQEYQDPKAATEAILHTLIANGLMGVSVQVENLTAIQNEVAFPVPAAGYTPGMKYAQKTYGRDGWGHEFLCNLIERSDDAPPKYRIISVGADGVAGTEDDIVLTIPRIGGSWGECVSGLYCRVSDGNIIVLLHRIDDSLFQLANSEDARKLTGGDLFDSFRLNTLLRHGGNAKGDKPPIVKAIEDWQSSHSGDDEEKGLLFAQFKGAKDE
jgi:hypothetical protein